MKWFFENKTLTSPTGKKHNFDFPIENIKDYHDNVIVLLDMPREKIDAQHPNAFLIKMNMDIVWGTIFEGLSRPYNAPFTGIMYVGDDKITLYSSDGFQVDLDVNDGHMLDARFTK